MKRLLPYITILTFIFSCSSADNTNANQLANELSAEVEKIKEEAKKAEEEAKRAEEEAKRAEEEALKKKNSWQIDYYVDDFGDKTDEGFVYKTVKNGKFSNSATNGSDLVVKFLIEPNKLAIVLYEYSKNIVNGSANYPKSYKVKIKDSNDEVFEFTGENYGNRLQFDEEENKQLIDLIDASQKLKFSITEMSKYGTPSSYQFILKNGAGLKQKLDEISA